MADPISLHVDTSGLVGWRRGVSSFTDRAAFLAGVDAQRRMRAEGSRKIRESKNIKVAAVNSAIKIAGPKSPKDVLVWKLSAGIESQRVMAFGPRPTRSGVSVTINKGTRTLLPHAFIATMPSSHKGVFGALRHGPGSTAGHRATMGKYKGKIRTPIRELWTTRISDAFGDAIPAMAERGRTTFVQSFTRILRAGSRREA